MTSLSNAQIKSYLFDDLPDYDYSDCKVVDELPTAYYDNLADYFGPTVETMKPASDSGNPRVPMVVDYCPETLLSTADTLITQLRSHADYHSNTPGFDYISGYKRITHWPGRYDIWPIANDVPRHPLIPQELTEKTVGLLLLDPNTNHYGKWHTDTMQLFHNQDNSEFPPFYYNVLIPLCDIGDSNGGTEFYVGGLIYKPKLKRGQAILFDGATMHRGTPNLSDKPRDVIYITYAAKWYNEERRWLLD